jgi:hypothetical protein
VLIQIRRFAEGLGESERVQGAVGAVYWNTAPAFFGINFVPAEFPTTA